MPAPGKTLLSLLLVALLTVSCQKLGHEAVGKGPLKLEEVAFDNAIPLEYGKLVSVTLHPDGGAWVLWFVKPDETIVAVGVDGKRGTIAPLALNIPRR
jgi:hypothetical protein